MEELKENWHISGFFYAWSYIKKEIYLRPTMFSEFSISPFFLDKIREMRSRRVLNIGARLFQIKALLFEI